MITARHRRPVAVEILQHLPAGVAQQLFVRRRRRQGVVAGVEGDVELRVDDHPRLPQRADRLDYAFAQRREPPADAFHPVAQRVEIGGAVRIISDVMDERIMGLPVAVRHTVAFQPSSFLPHSGICGGCVAIAIPSRDSHPESCPDQSCSLPAGRVSVSGVQFTRCAPTHSCHAEHEEARMKYMLLMASTSSDWDGSMSGLSHDELMAHIRFMHGVNAMLTETGELVDAVGLTAPDEARSCAPILPAPRW